MLHPVPIKGFQEDFNTLLQERGGLLTAAGTPVNPMTVGWGQIGRLWGKPVCTVYIRPQRFTAGLMKETSHFSLSFLPEDRHDVVSLCGSKSGRDVDKVKACGLTICSDLSAPYYAEAELVLICRTLYAQDMDSACFVEKDVDEKNYPGHDYHRMYVGEVETILKK